MCLTTAIFVEKRYTKTFKAMEKRFPPAIREKIDSRSAPIPEKPFFEAHQNANRK